MSRHAGNSIVAVCCSSNSCCTIAWITAIKSSLYTQQVLSLYKLYDMRSYRYHDRCIPEHSNYLQWLAWCLHFSVHFTEYESTLTGFVLSASDAATVNMPGHEAGHLSQHRESLASNLQTRSISDLQAQSTYNASSEEEEAAISGCRSSAMNGCISPQPSLHAATLLRCLDFSWIDR